MDHAQETAIWRAIGELESEVNELDKDVVSLCETLKVGLAGGRKGLVDSLWTLAVALVGAALVANLWLHEIPVRPTPSTIEFTISCPKQHETVCRVIAAEAERLAIEKFKPQTEVD